MATTDSSAPPRGMRDLLPGEVALRDWATAVIVKTYQSFGFSRIETPALENINLLKRSEGGENLQLIFEVLKRGDKLERELTAGQVNRADLADLGLRFDLTVPLVRFYANNQSTLPNPLKAIQIGPVWRAESPQAGRFRQFTQCDIDIFGIKTELAEIELVQATSQALLGLSFENFTVRINDRRVLSALVEHCGFAPEKADNVFITLDKLDKIQIEGVERELKAADHIDTAIEKLILFLRSLDQGDHFAQTRDLLEHASEPMERLANIINAVKAQSSGSYDIKFDPTLVRGMGYYTGAIFEISNPGYSHSIAGGGRYDKMVGKFSGRDVPACGFSIGFERIINILTEKKFTPPEAQKKLALIVDANSHDLSKVFSAAANLRSAGAVVSIQPRKKEMRKQLDTLVTQGFTAYAIFNAESDALEVKELTQ